MNRDGFLHDLNHTGFTVQRDAFDIDKINELNEFAETINPERGHTKDKKWIGWNQIKDIENPKTEIDWAYYWTEQVHHPIINEMKITLAQYADAAFGEHNWVWHVQDFIVLHPGMNFYRPHIDTPYRLWEQHQSGQEIDDISKITTGNFDFTKAKSGGLNVPFFSIYLPAETEEDGSAYEVANNLIDMVEDIVTLSPDKFTLIKSTDDISTSNVEPFHPSP